MPKQPPCRAPGLPLQPAALIQEESFHCACALKNGIRSCFKNSPAKERLLNAAQDLRRLLEGSAPQGLDMSSRVQRILCANLSLPPSAKSF